jgi:hypothetical protein
METHLFVPIAGSVSSIVANLDREKVASVREMSPEALPDLASHSGAVVNTAPCQTMKTRPNRGGRDPMATRSAWSGRRIPRENWRFFTVPPMSVALRTA